MNPRASWRVCAAMAHQRPDPSIERFVERTYVAMRVLIAATPLGSTGLVIGACASLTSEAEHAQGVVRLLTLGKLHPEIEIAGFMASIKDAPPAPAVTLDPVASDLPNGKVAFKVRVAPELAAAIERQREEDAAARQRRTGSPVIERPPADYHPAEYMTPEQEAEAEEQAERFQGLDDGDRE